MLWPLANPFHSKHFNRKKREDCTKKANVTNRPRGLSCWICSVKKASPIPTDPYSNSCLFFPSGTDFLRVGNPVQAESRDERASATLILVQAKRLRLPPTPCCHALQVILVNSRFTVGLHPLKEWLLKIWKSRLGLAVSVSLMVGLDHRKVLLS